MLVQLPRGTADNAQKAGGEDCTAFEAALRRDLASAPVVAYDSVLGGWAKRTVDLTLTLITLPLWLVLLVVMALSVKARHPATVFLSDERIGYGGRAFKSRRLRVSPPSAVIERLRPAKPGEPANDWGSYAQLADDRRAKWARAFERLPQLLNVLAGDMSLVGPRPLSREQMDQLKGGKRHYLSMRPGLISASAEEEAEDAVPYKLYAISWSLLLDAQIMREALRGLLNRGELWKPGRRKSRPVRARARVLSEPQPLTRGET